jgi:hypothetical protein
MKNLTKFASRITLASLVLMAVLVVPMNVFAQDPPIIVGGGGLAPSDPPVIIGGGYAVPSDPPILVGGGGYAASEPSILDEDAIMKMMIDLVIW